MQGFTDHEKALAVAAGRPRNGFTIALAEVSMYFDRPGRAARRSRMPS